MTLVRTSVDAFASEAAPSANYSQSVKLHMRADSPFRKYSYLFFAQPFPASNFPVGIISASLKLNLAGDWAGSQTITVERLQQSWKEGGAGGVNWNNKPAVSAAHPATSVTITNASDKAEIEITDPNLAQQMADVAGGSAWYGFRLSTSAATSRMVYSSDHPNVSLRPTLEVEWGEAPDPPDNLVPSGGKAISVSKPTLEWQFAEKGTHQKVEHQQASSQVQISTSTNFTAPEYDSTKIANTDSRWDLGATAYGGLSADAVRYWRVRVWDQSDFMSEWSDVQSFTRKTKGSLTIDNPSASPNNFVADLTPSIQWTFTGRTQEAFALTLYEVQANGDVELFRVAKTVASDISFTLPLTIKPTHAKAEKPLIKTGRTYRVRVRVFDTLDRQSIAGDPDYTVAERVFTYGRSGAPAPVTSLVAVASDASVSLTWTRTPVPDYFCLRVNGIEVIDQIDPADVFVSGTTYQFIYWEAKPRDANTYEVEAVALTSGVGMAHSDGNATATATTSPTGIWVVDPEDSRHARIDGQEPASLDIRETGTTYDVLGSRVPVRITDALMGYSGTIGGTIITEQVRDDFLELKYRQKALRLILSDLNIPVVLEEASVSPTPIPGTRMYDVSFSCFQVDEFFEVDFEAAAFIEEPPPDDPPPPPTDDSALLGELQPGAGVPGN